ncbi:KATNB1-like protein 1 [Oncorhynchus keta]|uniref:KATNB1-like protein 1 n=1 Tax=Oncorhynchus keta TaxID=8018 RepID=UPI00227D6FBF|nr:KATNB1-like protein 1 [Oncorhynchus keta]XP_035631201.2 KATNB1-like protein 1 [Oncorhynchus keta]
MATGSHYGQGREFRQLNQGKPRGFLHHISNHYAADKNMKEADFLNKEEIDKDRFPVSRCARIKAKRVSVCNKRKLSSRHSVVVSSGVPRRVPPAGRAVCDMANKENELTCPEKVQAIHYNDNCMFPVNSAAEAGSKMAGPGNKYSDYFTELSKDHDAMTHVLFGRNLRLNVALTLWRRNACELVAYLIRIEDTGVLLDCLPVITKSLQDETPCISLGCCVDLLPQVKSILTSEYEEHLIVVLHWVQSVVKKWWPELSTNGKSLLDSCSEYRNLQVMKQQLKEFWVEGPQLSLVPGTTGEMAKAIGSYLSQLH